MYTGMKDDLAGALAQMRIDGLYKEEGILTTPQGPVIGVGGADVLNLCANNYLGLADHPRLIQAARDGLDRWGFGLASVRFICGTQEIHTELERRIADFLHTDSAILYSSCYDANGGLFETLLGRGRCGDLRRAEPREHHRRRAAVQGEAPALPQPRHGDLKHRLEEAADARYRLIATDGVFSMDGYLAPLDQIVELAERHDALVMVDDSHAVGFLGPTGAGTPELFGVQDRIDIVTGTLGKALGGASGGFTAARSEIVETLRQRSRPYLFSNSLAPAIVTAAIAVLDLLAESGDLLDRLRENTAWFRREITVAGFTRSGVRPSHRPGHDRRCRRSRQDGGITAAQGDLRPCLQLSGGPAPTRRVSARRCRPRTRRTISNARWTPS